jgi:phosphoketolase
MYLNKYKKPEDLKLEDLKNYNPGHLGSSIGINFILANLNYFINKNNLKSKTVVGTGHAGVSLTSNIDWYEVMISYCEKEVGE